MAFPKTNETARIYREKDGSFLLVFTDQTGPGGMDAVGNVLEGSAPSLGSTTVSRGYLSDWRSGPKRCGWDAMPPEWQRAFLPWIEPLLPESIRGFWPVGMQPKTTNPNP
jgi:hypothetical protein